MADERVTIRTEVQLEGWPYPGPCHRVLVTGSRDWTNGHEVYEALRWAVCHENTVIVHGACPTGADKMAGTWASIIGYPEEPHPADWTSYGKAAGFRRNAEMVALGADVCLAFIRNGSKGATHTADLAEKAGIKTLRWTQTDPPDHATDPPEPTATSEERPT